MSRMKKVFMNKSKAVQKIRGLNRFTRKAGRKWKKTLVKTTLNNNLIHNQMLSAKAPVSPNSQWIQKGKPAKYQVIENDNQFYNLIIIAYYKYKFG